MGMCKWSCDYWGNRSSVNQCKCSEWSRSSSSQMNFCHITLTMVAGRVLQAWEKMQSTLGDLEKVSKATSHFLKINQGKKDAGGQVTEMFKKLEKSLEKAKNLEACQLGVTHPFLSLHIFTPTCLALSLFLLLSIDVGDNNVCLKWRLVHLFLSLSVGKDYLALSARSS